jgi:hypothetical protein
LRYAVCLNFENTSYLSIESRNLMTFQIRLPFTSPLRSTEQSNLMLPFSRTETSLHGKFPYLLNSFSKYRKFLYMVACSTYIVSRSGHRRRCCGVVGEVLLWPPLVLLLAMSSKESKLAGHGGGKAGLYSSPRPEEPFEQSRGYERNRKDRSPPHHFQLH